MCIISRPKCKKTEFCRDHGTKAPEIDKYSRKNQAGKACRDEVAGTKLKGQGRYGLNALYFTTFDIKTRSQTVWHWVIFCLPVCMYVCMYVCLHVWEPAYLGAIFLRNWGLKKKKVWGQKQDTLINKIPFSILCVLLLECKHLKKYIYWEDMTDPLMLKRGHNVVTITYFYRT